jgi:preprotein translocase subunit SecG
VHIFITIVHIVVCITLVIVVLLQRGKGASMGAAFGGSSQTIFGSMGPGTFLGKMTTVAAVVFMLTSLWLAYFATHKSDSIVQTPSPTATEQPVAPTTPPVPSPETGK